MCFTKNVGIQREKNMLNTFEQKIKTDKRFRTGKSFGVFFPFIFLPTGGIGSEAEQLPIKWLQKT